MQIAYGTQPFQIQQAVPNQAIGGYHTREPVSAAPANARPLFRLHVHNVPQYLSLEEFRNQFMKVEGCVNASLEKSDTGYDSGHVVDSERVRNMSSERREWLSLTPTHTYRLLGHFVDFVSQEFAEKCASTFSNWKGASYSSLFTPACTLACE